eukprot:GDKJ01059063.1.p1 GENE.GDKJ01059063.1~~GDKJ01059063.1.p1  ORF type:complete len:104 (+),score=5.92 GDKJ01059063.1:834-1145(+)
MSFFCSILYTHISESTKRGKSSELSHTLHHFCIPLQNETLSLPFNVFSFQRGENDEISQLVSVKDWFVSLKIIILFDCRFCSSKISLVKKTNTIKKRPTMFKL